MKDDCREVLDDLDFYLDGECPEQLEAAIARHLADCSPCISRSDFERALRAIIAQHCRESPPPDLLSRVLASLR